MKALPDPENTSLEESLWDAVDVGRYLKVSRSWVYHQTEAGLLPHLRVGSLLRFDPDANRAHAKGNKRDATSTSSVSDDDNPACITSSRKCAAITSSRFGQARRAISLSTRCRTALAPYSYPTLKYASSRSARSSFKRASSCRNDWASPPSALLTRS